MLGLPSRYLLKHPKVIADLVADPIVVWTRIQDAYIDKREQRAPPRVYNSDQDWERLLHEQLNANWPCMFTRSSGTCGPK
jgi:hypothetical protein